MTPCGTQFLGRGSLPRPAATPANPLCATMSAINRNDQPKPAPQTIKQRLSVLRSLYRFHCGQPLPCGATPSPAILPIAAVRLRVRRNQLSPVPALWWRNTHAKSECGWRKELFRGHRLHGACERGAMDARGSSYRRGRLIGCGAGARQPRCSAFLRTNLQLWRARSACWEQRPRLRHGCPRGIGGSDEGLASRGGRFKSSLPGCQARTAGPTPSVSDQLMRYNS